MSNKTAVIVTSINPPNHVMRAIAQGSQAAGWDFICAGDTKSPADFHLEGCTFLSVDAQVATGFKFAALCPTRHYARKNVAYLVAISRGADVIVETDDDNIPRAEFFLPRTRKHQTPSLDASRWVNVYKYFSDALIWPRGLPLDRVNDALPEWTALPVSDSDCPIQQGLADENPDVDAIYRLLLPLPQNFKKGRLALGGNAWCPFNSQNTTFYPDGYPLLYLPAYCSFRMTDIWRSFVAQVIAYANGWRILYHEATVWQERNAHNLMRDFADEVSGYLNNEAIREALMSLPIAAGVAEIPANMRKCYAKLVEMKLVGEKELPLLEAWLDDLSALARAS